MTAPTPPPEDEDFSRLLEESLEPRRFRQGDSVSGTVVALGPEVAFVDVGGKGEATIEIEEFTDPDGTVRVKIGDTVAAVVVSTEGGLKLSHKLARQAATREALREASQSGLPVEGRVEELNKGGYEIRFSGQRAFCPLSQIDAGYTEEPAIHLGKVYAFRVIEYKQDGKRIVVSRRVLLEEERQRRAEEVRRLIVPDAVLPGRVVSVRDYGAFVDLGGVQGLLHVSEMGWSRVTDPTTVVRVGDEIEVKVLQVDEEKGKISLGLKQLQADPWSTAGSAYRVGQVLMGRVTRTTDFGAFIEVEPGIEALAHVSTFPPTGTTGGWKSSAPPGGRVPVEILSIDTERKRMGVAIAEEGSPRADRAKAEDGRAGGPVEIRAGARLVGKVERHESYGIFVFLKPGRTGLLPVEEIRLERGADATKVFPVGSDIEIMVLEVEPSGRRIRLSRKSILEANERQEAREYQARESERGGFGSLADRLREAMEKRNR
jgi:small subunit ribosomal protein S1